MSFFSKISLFVISLIMITYLAYQSMILLDFINVSKSDIGQFSLICFIFFIPFFSFIVREIIKKSKKNQKLNIYTQKLNQVLISQSHNSLFYEGKVSQGAKELTKQVATSICTDRCSIWLYNSDKTSIICQQLYIKSEDNWYQNIELFEKDFLGYFEALKIDPIIVANDAETHPATTCFKDVYLKPLGIKSMLDVPIVFRGEVIGVICIESLTKRNWIETEVNFAQMLSSLYSFAYSVKEGNKSKRIAEEMQKFINEAALVSKADAKGKITYVNKKFIDVSGWTLEEALGKDHNIVNSGTHTKDFWSDLYKTTIKEKKVWNKIVTNKSKSGDLYYVDTYVKAEFDTETEELTGFTSIRNDVTEIKLKELEIQNQINAINKSNSVVIFDLEGNILHANNKFLNIMGFDYAKNGGLDEIIGKHHSIFLTKEDSNCEEYKEFWRDLNDGKYLSGEFKRLRKDGKVVWLSATYNPIFDTSGKVYKIMKIATDITESVNDKEEINKKNTYLEHSAKILRHDMHSGINTYIPRGISSLERRLTQEDIERLKLEAPLKMIKEGLKHTQKVYKGVYEFTNLVKKEVVLSKTECNVKTILNDYLSSTSYKSQVYLDENLPNLELNEALFCTAIDNLIRNGLKYNDSPSKLVKVYLESERKKFGLRKKFIIVEDNGRGITQEEFEHLSKPYVRKEGQKESGTGLGLNICKAILQEHGFEITAEKLKTGGTKLKIKI